MIEFSNEQIQIESIPKADHLVFQPLDRNLVKIKLINWLIGLLIVVGLICLLYYFKKDLFMDQQYLWVAYVALGLFFAFKAVVIVKEFPFLGYALRQKDIIYRDGWLNKKWTHIPFNRIQHAEVTQGPIYRIFKLSKLKVFTAGGSASDLSISGIPMQEAIDMKGLILKKTTNDFNEEE